MSVWSGRRGRRRQPGHRVLARGHRAAAGVRHRRASRITWTAWPRLGTKFVLVLNMDSVLSPTTMPVVSMAIGQPFGQSPSSGRGLDLVSLPAGAVRHGRHHGLARSSDALFAKFRDLIYREAGIALTDMKKALLIGRLAGRLRELGLPSFDDYYALVERSGRRSTSEADAGPDLHERDAVLPRRRQFQFLDDHVFPLHGGRSRAAGARGGCGRGARRAPPAKSRTRWRWRCCAGSPRRPAGRWKSSPRDLSNKVLAIARAGMWPLRNRRTSRSHYRKAFMLRGTGSQAGKMKAGPEIRDVVSFDAAQPQRPGLSGDGAVRLHLLPQRADLLRPRVEVQAW